MPRILFPVLLAAACAYPRYTASKVVELEVPLEQAEALRCTTHNGGIVVTAGGAADSIAVRVDLSVRGHSEDDARANLELLSIGQHRNGDELSLYGDCPRDALRGMSPSFAFTMTVPEKLALTLLTHNGSVRTAGTRGALEVETHNGSVDCSVANPGVEITTHNGSVALAVTAPGELDGSITTHNGSVLVTLDEDASGWITAHTHNGSITPPANARDVTSSRRSLRCCVGDASSNGSLQVETHNGRIVLRTGAAHVVVQR